MEVPQPVENQPEVVPPGAGEVQVDTEGFRLVSSKKRAAHLGSSAPVEMVTPTITSNAFGSLANKEKDGEEEGLKTLS